MNKLKCAVIGGGYFGKFHAQKYAALNDCELVAVADTNPATCTAIASEINAPTCSDYRTLIGSIAAASIVTPTTTHYAIARDLLENGIHVLLEKPMTNTLEEADRLIEVAAENNVVLQIGHIERFNPALTRIKHTITKPEFIEVLRLTGYRDRNTEVGVILDLMIHDLDIVLDLVDAEVESINAKGVRVWSDEIDIINARLIFADGCVVNITESRISLKSERKIRIFSQYDGYHSIDMQNGTSEHYQIQNRKRRDFSRQSYPRIADADPLLDEIKHFLSCIGNKTSPKVGGSEGRSALVLAQRVHDSLLNND